MEVCFCSLSLSIYLTYIALWNGAPSGNKSGITLLNVSIQQQESGRGGSESEHCGVPQREITGRETRFKGGQDGRRINGEQGNIT